MDKYDLVLDIIEHPENYTSEQLTEILSDPETKAVYILLCKTESAMTVSRKIDVDTEWNRFSSRNNGRPRRSFMWFGSRAASIVAIICTSIVAVAAGIAVTISVNRGPKSEAVAEQETAVTVPAASVTTEPLSLKPDTASDALTPVMFEDETLSAIMKAIADAYDVRVAFNNPETASLHLYYRFDPALPLDEIVSQLNTFEQINIHRSGNSLSID